MSRGLRCEEWAIQVIEVGAFDPVAIGGHGDQDSTIRQGVDGAQRSPLNFDLYFRLDLAGKPGVEDEE